MQLERIRASIDSELEATEKLLADLIAQDLMVPSKKIPAIANEIGKHLIKGGGKRLRPMLTLFSAKCCGVSKDDKHIKLAAVVELIHVATLLHDDVVDDSKQRRGKLSANVIWSNSASILVGDYFISRAFELVSSLDDITIIKLLAHTTNTMASGEVMQLMQRHNYKISLSDYKNIIYCKTAVLFKAAMVMGAICVGASETEKELLGAYGEHLGNAFQMVDDLLDYSGNQKEIGKNIGDDLAEGKATMPLIFCLASNKLNLVEKAKIEQSIAKGQIDCFDSIQQAILKSGAIEKTIQAAHAEAQLAINSLSGLTDNIYKDKLIELARFAVVRAK